MPTKKAPKPPVPVICIQEIETSWTKLSRGGEGAVKRGHVPEAVELPLPIPHPSPPTDTYPFFLHLLGYSEYTEYKQWSEFLRSDVSANDDADILNRGGVRVSFNGEALTARYQWNWDLGAPGRRTQNAAGMFVPVHHSPTQKAFEVEVGQWGRMLYNGRHTYDDSGRWHYSKNIFNIGLFINPQPDVFLTTPPIKIYSKMAHLF